MRKLASYFFTALTRVRKLASYFFTVLFLSACVYEHAYYPPHGPSSGTFLEPGLAGYIHVPHRLQEPIPCDVDIRVWTKAIEKKHRIYTTSHFIVWNLRTDCEHVYSGGKSWQYTAGDIVIPERVSYLGWSPEIHPNKEYSIFRHEIRHQAGQRHCTNETVANSTICID